jgi:hypothetical protein
MKFGFTKTTLHSAHKMKKQNINVPFRIKIPAGQCKFTIPVPKDFNDRLYSFNELVLEPDFMSLLAADYEMDTDEELHEVVEYPMFVSAAINGTLYPGVVAIPSTVVTTPQLAKFVSDIFEGLKPEGLKRDGHFFDWVDLSYDPKEETWDAYVRKKALAYYGREFDPAVHFNALPSSVRDLKGTNNYLFPTQPPDAVKIQLRFRMWVAPNIVAWYTSDLQLYDLGFSKAQLGNRNKKKQYEFANDKDNGYQMFQAEEEYMTNVSKKTPLKISLPTNTKNFVSGIENVLVTREKARINVEMLAETSKALVQLVEMSNVVMALTYDPDAKKFKFSFPTNPALDVTLHPAENLSQRLGFNLISNISNQNPESVEKVEDARDIKNAEKKARALVHDTSIVIVSDDNSKSMTTVGISEQFMASLMPTVDGTLVMSKCEEHAPRMRLPSVFTGSSAIVPATFKLHRFLDHENLVNLQWRHDCYVYGVLRGSPL